MISSKIGLASLKIAVLVSEDHLKMSPFLDPSRTATSLEKNQENQDSYN